jgi:hypothetical protein
VCLLLPIIQFNLSVVVSRSLSSHEECILFSSPVEFSEYISKIFQKDSFLKDFAERRETSLWVGRSAGYVWNFTVKMRSSWQAHELETLHALLLLSISD